MKFTMPRLVNIDDLAEGSSMEEGPLPPPDTVLRQVYHIAQQHPEKMLSVFVELPAVDYEICRLYFVEGLTQEGVSQLVGIGQPEVSGRLHSCIKLLPHLLNRPTRSPIQLRNDFLELLPRRLVEPAHVLYLNVSPSRAALLLGVSESTARNLQKEIVTHLEKLVCLPGRAPYDHAALRGLSLIDSDGAILADDEVARRREVALSYLEDFRSAKKVSARLVRPFRKNEAARANAVIEGEPIAGPSAS